MITTTRHAIRARYDTFNFALWRGPGPRTVRQSVENFTRPGADGTGFQLQGTRGRPFTAETVAFFPDFVTAENRRIAYTQAIGDFAYVKWETLLFETLNHIFFVQHVEASVIKSRIRAMGQEYNYVYPTELVARWVLVPIWVVPTS